MLDKDQFKKIEKIAAAKKSQPADNFQTSLLKQASVKSRWLVNSPHWDAYLTWVQADIEDINKMIESAREVLENPAVTNHDDLMRAKIVLLESKAMIKALNVAISYPTQIIKEKKSLDEREKDLHLEAD